MNNNPVIKKILYRINLKFLSPVNVSSGKDGMTDNDVLKDYNGAPFIPGTSITGAFRAYVEHRKGMRSVFGYSDENDNGKMSAIGISDLTFDNRPVMDIRDSVALDEHKIARQGAKFDFEVLEGETTTGTFFVELTLRENDDEDEYIDVLNEVFSGIQKHEIRIGSNKTRGYGIVKITELKKKEYTKKNYLKYADAYEDEGWKSVNALPLKFTYEHHWIHIEVPLKQKGGISIRKYMIQNEGSNFESITDHQLPVIPGTSFNGAIRHRLYEILGGLGEISDSADKVLRIMFGYVKKDVSHKSRVIIDETVIHHAKPLTTVRTGISRFEGAVKTGALYKEKTYVDGDMVLRLAVPVTEETEWIIGFLLLALKDLQNGFLAVGGQTAVGRGVFAANGNILIDGKENMVDTYISASLEKYMEMNRYE